MTNVWKTVMDGMAYLESRVDCAWEGLGFNWPGGSKREEAATVMEEGRDTGQTVTSTKSIWIRIGGS